MDGYYGDRVGMMCMFRDVDEAENVDVDDGGGGFCKYCLICLCLLQCSVESKYAYSLDTICRSSCILSAKRKLHHVGRRHH